MNQRKLWIDMLFICCGANLCFSASPVLYQVLENLLSSLGFEQYDDYGLI